VSQMQHLDNDLHTDRCIAHPPTPQDPSTTTRVSARALQLQKLSQFRLAVPLKVETAATVPFQVVMEVPVVATPAMVATLAVTLAVILAATPAAILAATPAAILAATPGMTAPTMAALITAPLLFLQPALPPPQLLALPQLDQGLLQLPLQTSLLLSQCC
jgi:hypothetical protein